MPVRIYALTYACASKPRNSAGKGGMLPYAANGAVGSSSLRANSCAGNSCTVPQVFALLGLTPVAKPSLDSVVIDVKEISTSVTITMTHFSSPMRYQISSCRWQPPFEEGVRCPAVRANQQ